MELNEIRELSPNELEKKIYDLRVELFTLRRKKAVGNLEHGEQLRAVRKDLARALTVKRERELEIKR
ncbi:MAG: 50S ribosomal protein L29 [Bacilli bacterium]|nr:50S ribosomal protein L29 [Bacilli bacterium]